MIDVLVIDFWGGHGLSIKDAVSLGYGEDISDRIEIYSDGGYSIENVKTGIDYAKQNDIKIVIFSAAGAPNFIEKADQVYPSPLVFIPAGGNYLLELFHYPIPQKLLIVGAGDGYNETADNIEFYSHDPIVNDEQDYSSFSNGYIAGQLLFISDSLNCPLWEARYRAKLTGSENNVWHEVNGYGKINTTEAINYTGTIPLSDPYSEIILPDNLPEPPPIPVPPSLGNFSSLSFVENQNLILIKWNKVSLATSYKVYRRTDLISHFTEITHTIDLSFLDKKVERIAGTYIYKIKAFYLDQVAESDEIEVPFRKIDEIFVR